MLDDRELKKLKAINNKDHLITTLYLRTDGGAVKKKGYEIQLKDLIKEKSFKLEKWGFDRTQRENAKDDLKRIQSYITSGYKPKGEKSIALFSCGSKKLWQVYHLPRPVRNCLFIDKKPHIRTLIKLQNQQKRYCFVLIDRSKARLFEFYMGKIVEYPKIIDEVPGQVREGGYSGYSEKRIKRHIQDHVHRHMKNVSDQAFRIFNKKKYEYLVIAGNQDLFPEFERNLHKYIEGRIAARIPMQLNTSLKDIVNKILEIDNSVIEFEEENFVNRLIEDASQNKLAVVGLQKTLKALNNGQMRTLIISDTFNRSGTVCEKCNFLGEKGRKVCPHCNSKLKKVPDIAEEAMDLAVKGGCDIEHIFKSRRFENMDGIGSILRFKRSS